MGELRVVAPPDAAVGYRLAGARTEVTDTADRVRDLVQAAITDGTDDVIAVHSRLWQALPERDRQHWEQSSLPLIVALPSDSGDAAADRGAALRDLPTRAVGYEITFSPEGQT